MLRGQTAFDEASGRLARCPGALDVTPLSFHHDESGQRTRLHLGLFFDAREAHRIQEVLLGLVEPVEEQQATPIVDARPLIR
jgi:hypothetical protein